MLPRPLRNPVFSPGRCVVPYEVSQHRKDLTQRFAARSCKFVSARTWLVPGLRRDWVRALPIWITYWTLDFAMPVRSSNLRSRHLGRKLIAQRCWEMTTLAVSTLINQEDVPPSRVKAYGSSTKVHEVSILRRPGAGLSSACPRHRGVRRIHPPPPEIKDETYEWLRDSSTFFTFAPVWEAECSRSSWIFS